MKFSRLSIVMVVAMGLAIGCGDDDGDGVDTPPADMFVGTDGDPGSDAEVGGNTIIDILQARGNFTTIVAATDRAGLSSLLGAPGAFTIFAPTDEAFEALGLDLSTLSDEQLSGILTYHALLSVVRSTEIPATADAANLLTLAFDTSDGVMVNNAMVIEADIEADNGIIHVIDTVLLPPDIPTMAGYLGATALTDALASADLVSTLQAPGPFTVFAPTNEAFATAGDVPADALAGILTYHVVGAAVPSTSIPERADSLSTNEWGNPITLFFDTAADPMVNDATVVLADVKTTNGIIHVVDTVLVPPTVADAAGFAGLNTLLEAVGAASEIVAGTTVADVLGGSGPVTVFAPTDMAFADWGVDLASADPDIVRDVLLYHLVDNDVAPVLSTDLTDGAVPTALGQDVTIDTAGPTVNGQNIVVVDVHTSNGVVHVIDGVLTPSP